MKCPGCQFENPDGAKSCERCGAALPPLDETRDGPTMTVRSPLKDVASGDILAGKYEIEETLGKGGMGTVFKARQIKPVRRSVAVKVIKLGMDTNEVIARFEAERQALAVMDHPNIAKVLDGGATDTGRPFFVMELVKGIPITKYCDMNRLSTRERLGLFVPVRQAVQHAHQKGVIHRDLKPTNVLVSIQDDRPVPKIIDFGIAKATDHRLSERTVFTELGQLIGTPEYMSPEQAEMSGLDIDARTDIYSLGVMLYELLVGVLPFDPKALRSAAFAEIQRIIRETDPPRASTRLSSLGDTQKSIAEHRRTDPGGLRKQLRGDLDWIIVKAMEKDRTRRYDTSSGLASDIERYLRHEPIAARPPSPWYKTSKFARRHKLGLAAGSLVALALVAGLTLATIGLVRAKRAEAAAAAERDRANLEATTAKQVSDFLVGLFRVSDPSEALGNSVTAREILDKGADRIKEELREQPLVQARLMGTMGEVYTNLGLFDQATSLMEQSLETRRGVLGNEHIDVIDSLNSLAVLLYSKGRYQEAERHFRETLRVCQALFGEDGPEVANCQNNLAMTLKAQNKLEEAEPLYRRALEIRREHLGDKSPEVAQSLNNLGMFLYARKQYDEAEPLLREALAMNRKLLGEEHPEISANLSNLGLVLRAGGQTQEAERVFREVVALDRKIYGDEHPYVATSLINLAVMLANAGELAEAQKLFQESILIRRKVFSDSHWETATAKSMLGGYLIKAEKYEEAEPLLVESYGIIRNQFGPSHPRTTSALRRIITLYRSWGKPEKAAEYGRLLKKN
jgi:serine/threonine protein kinase/tetratricopeptide (TPR) repeat protein